MAVLKSATELFIMFLVNVTGDERFCSSDPELLRLFDLSGWWPPLFIVLTVLSVILTLALLICRIAFRRSVKPFVNVYGTWATCSSFLMTIHTWLSIPGPLLTSEASTSLAIVYVSFSAAIAIINTASFINLRNVRQISSFDVSIKVNIPSLKMLWGFEVCFGVFPPIAAVPVVIAYASSGCHLAGNYLRIVSAFMTVPQLATAASWLTFGSMASATLSKYQRDGVSGANTEEWVARIKNLKRKIVSIGIMTAFITVMACIPNALAAYTPLLDESPGFHAFLRILGIVLMILPSINHLHHIYATRLTEHKLSKRTRTVHPSLQATAATAATTKNIKQPSRTSSD